MPHRGCSAAALAHLPGKHRSKTEMRPVLSAAALKGASHSSGQSRLKKRYANSGEVVKGRVVEGRWACRVGGIARRNKNDHALAGTSEEDTVVIAEILAAI